MMRCADLRRCSSLGFIVYRYVPTYDFLFQMVAAHHFISLRRRSGLHSPYIHCFFISRILQYTA
eukprot:3846439-Pleurochrysis_carterae.AAC.1